MADRTSHREYLVRQMGRKGYREAYHKADTREGLAAQIRAIRNARGWTQAELGAQANMLQSRVSTLENPDSRLPSLSTLTKLADAFDVVLSVRFVPFSQLVNWSVELDSADLAVPTFENDPGFDEALGAMSESTDVPPIDSQTSFQEPFWANAAGVAIFADYRSGAVETGARVAVSPHRTEAQYA